MFFPILYWSLCVLIGINLGFWVWRKDKRLKQKAYWLPAVFRAFSGFLIAALLLAPLLSYVKNTTQKPLIVWLQDNSSSVKDGLGNDLKAFQERKKELQNELGDDFELVELQFGEDVKKSDNNDFTASITNIEKALTHAFQRYKGGNLSAVILPSDGIFNEGADPMFTTQFLNVPIYAIALGDSTSPKDISVLRIFSNKVVMTGNSFEIATDVRFSKLAGTQHSIQLYQNGSLLQSKSVNIDEDEQVVSTSFEVKAGSPGMIHYAIIVPAIEGEKSNLNNKIDFYVQVISNEMRVLILNNGSHPDIGFIQQALKTTAGYKIDIASPNQLPENFTEYQAIIAFQPEFNQQQWDKIKAQKTPVWHILGNQTNRFQIDIIKDWVKVSGAQPASFQTPVLRAQFTAFLLPSSTAAVLAQLPPLESNVQVAKALQPNEVVLKSKENSNDIWFVHAGVQPAAMTIGEGLWRWGIFEYKSNKNKLVTQELIRQTVRTLNVPKQDKPFQVFLSKRLLTDNEDVAFTAELRNKTGQLVNSEPVKLLVTDSAGKTTEFEMEKFGNQYQKVLPKMGAGKYEYKGIVNYEGKSFADEGSFAVENIPLEQIDTRAKYEMMYQLAQQSNGKFYTLENMNGIFKDIKSNANIKSKIISEEIKEPLIHYKWLFALLLLFLTIEWLWRKYYNMQ